MIIGDGDIASVLIHRNGAVFFACGVSNSSETNDKAFRRERDTLLDAHDRFPDACLFYFSTISKFYPNPSPYIKHKMNMERVVSTNWENYCILRIGNITWGTNPNTFLNKMRAMKAAGTPLPVRDEWKYMITEYHLLSLTNNLPLDQKIEICAFSYMAKVIDLL